jgi:dipeptidyl aminopeptidase/acylaminoacyl peptidase
MKTPAEAFLADDYIAKRRLLIDPAKAMERPAPGDAVTKSDTIYLTTADGGTQTRLTNTGARDAHPVWSPDGTRLSFVSERDGNPEIYTMAADGALQTRLTNEAARDEPVAWVP